MAKDKKSTTPVEHYKRSILAVGLRFHEVGEVYIDTGDTQVPMMVEDKILTLPTDELLRNPTWDSHIAFHPLCENILRGESPVLEKTRLCMMYRLQVVMTKLISELVDLAASTDRHSQLSDDQHRVLNVLAKVDKKSPDNFRKVLRKVDYDSPNRMVSIFVVKDGKIGGEVYSRKTSVRAPILEEQGNEDRSVFGVKLRKNDFPAFMGLIRYILPGIEDGEYDCGANSNVAPRYQSMMAAYGKVAAQLNKIVALYKNVFIGTDDLHIPTEFVHDLDDLERFRDRIPTLEGNEGKTSARQGNVDTQSGAAALAAAPTTSSPAPAPTSTYTPPPADSGVQRTATPQPYTPPAQAAPAPAPQPGPHRGTESGKVSMADIMARQHANQPAPPQYPPQGGYMPPQQGYGMPPQQQPPYGYPQQPVNPYMVHVQQPQPPQTYHDLRQATPYGGQRAPYGRGPGY